MKDKILKLLSLLKKHFLASKEWLICLTPFFVFLLLFLITEPLLSLEQLPGCVWERAPGASRSFILFLCGIPLQALVFGFLFLLPCKICLVFLSLLIIAYNVYIITDVFLFFTQKQIINPDMLAVMGGTNWQEIVNFAEIYKGAAAVLILYSVVLLIFLIAYCIKAAYQIPFKKRIIVSGLCIIPMIILFICNSKDVRAKRFGFIVYQPSALSYLQVIFKQSNLRSTNQRLEESKRDLKFDFTTPVTGVVIIGESASRDYMGCYGYAKDTTPYMNQDSWIKYNDVITGSPYTHVSTHLMFTDKCVNGGQATIAIPALLSKNKDCFVSYTSNQPCGLFDAITPLFAPSNCRSLLKNDPETNNCTDEELLKFVPVRNGTDKIKRLHLIHLAGSHFPYSHSYPADFCKMGFENEINHYENSILYTDYIAECVKNMFKDEKTPVWILYLSDHGESPGGTMRDVTKYSVWEIPFAFYANEAFQKAFPDMYEKMKKAADVPFTSDCTFEIILYLMGISFDGFQQQRIPLLESYVPQKRTPGQLPDRHPGK